MENNLSFMFHESTAVRATLDEHGEPWFVAKDVCDCLGLDNSRQALSRIPEGEKGVIKIYTPGGTQELSTVNEPGLYRLIFTSNKPEAQSFQDWVYRVVLPSIRRTGSYSHASAGERRLTMSLNKTKLGLMQSLCEEQNIVIRAELVNQLQWTCLQLQHDMPELASLQPKQLQLAA